MSKVAELQNTLDDEYLEPVESPKLAKTIEEVATEQGIKPFDFEEAWQAAAGLWPEDENIDDFTTWLRESRNDGAAESRFDRCLP